MNESFLQAFINLVKFDQSIIDFQQEVTAISEAVRLLEQELEKELLYKQSLEKHINRLQEEVHIKEKEMQELALQEEKKRKKLDALTHPREVQSLYKEIESVKKDQYDFEEVLLLAWQKFEQAKTNLQLYLPMHEQKTAAFNARIIQQLQQIEIIKEKINDLQSLRFQKIENIPQEWLEKYAAMYSRVRNPVVPVIRGSCSACFYHILDQDLVRLKHRALLECKDCYRFLYFEQPT